MVKQSDIQAYLSSACSDSPSDSSLSETFFLPFPTSTSSFSHSSVPWQLTSSVLVSRGWSVLSLVAVVEDDAELRLPRANNHNQMTCLSIKQRMASSIDYPIRTRTHTMDSFARSSSCQWAHVPDTGALCSLGVVLVAGDPHVLGIRVRGAGDRENTHGGSRPARFTRQFVSLELESVESGDSARVSWVLWQYLSLAAFFRRPRPLPPSLRLARLHKGRHMQDNFQCESERRSPFHITCPP